MPEAEPPSTAKQRALYSTVEGDVLTITLRKEFDSGNIHQDWAQSIQVMHVGPYAKVVFDLSQCGSLSSTFFAGLFQLHVFYSAKGMPPIVLSKPDTRMVRNLQALRLTEFFTLDQR
ncbi:MAG: hypothetical protein AAB263_21115 [Planctomycetota bacterium]